MTPRPGCVSCAPISPQELDERLPRHNMKHSPLRGNPSTINPHPPFLTIHHYITLDIQTPTGQDNERQILYSIPSKLQQEHRVLFQCPQALGSLHRSARQKYTTNQQPPIASDNGEDLVDPKAVAAPIYPSPNLPKWHFEWLGCAQSESLSLRL
ncbi:hypothetical protein BDZ45DRAFT_231161 [Acephala macrosclerotiorum]|nr:hypothetical protein BDZ45DRAFT_231161 [Acephala macrosclerotiorum]